MTVKKEAKQAAAAVKAHEATRKQQVTLQEIRDYTIELVRLSKLAKAARLATYVD